MLRGEFDSLKQGVGMQGQAVISGRKNLLAKWRRYDLFRITWFPNARKAAPLYGGVVPERKS